MITATVATGHDAEYDGRCRAVIESVTPAVDDGRYPCKRVVGDEVVVRCDVFNDGHDRVSAVVLYRAIDDDWQEAPLEPLVNDAWEGRFTVSRAGLYEFTVEAWVDHIKTWQHDLGRREDERDIAVHLVDGVKMIRDAATRAAAADATELEDWAAEIESSATPVMNRRELALDKRLGVLAERYASRELAVRYDRNLPVRVDDALAGCSAWYEFFPRSTVVRGTPGNDRLSAPGSLPHGTFLDATERLAYIADLGFDIVYLPPVHPIGRVNRKGRNNVLNAEDDDVGVCWAIGAEEGGHKALLPELGTLEDFRKLVTAAREAGLEVAMDIAFQCAPDHPYVSSHPDWFKWRSDGVVQYAENPPKKYQDIYPFDFECADWQGLWNELRDVFLYWIEQGVRIFRVDNPHTKPFAFWEWVIAEIKRERPDAILLAEAFTRPKIMHRLAKLGFTQSYTYFTWRNSKAELESYLMEVSQGPGREYFRPNFWPNTPDILHETLQKGGRPASALRLVLAATMSSNYGIYGPVFELGYVTPREAGSEEYLDSEKYQLRQWYLDSPDSLAPLLQRINAIRAANPALRTTFNAALHYIDNDRLICFSKRTSVAVAGNTQSIADETGGPQYNTLLVVVNLDPHATQAGWTSLDMPALGLAHDADFDVVDLLNDEHYHWSGPHNFVLLDPARTPAHVLLIKAPRPEGTV